MGERIDEEGDKSVGKRGQEKENHFRSALANLGGATRFKPFPNSTNMFLSLTVEREVSLSKSQHTSVLNKVVYLCALCWSALGAGELSPPRRVVVG